MMKVGDKVCVVDAEPRYNLFKYENGMKGVVVGESLDAVIVKFDNGEEECVTINELIEEKTLSVSKV